MNSDQVTQEDSGRVKKSQEHSGTLRKTGGRVTQGVIVASRKETRPSNMYLRIIHNILIINRPGVAGAVP